MGRLDDALKALETAIGAVRWQAQAAIAAAAEDEHGKSVEQRCATIITDVDKLVTAHASMVRALAHARRPKGPTITLRYSTKEDTADVVEVVRRDRQAFTVRSGYGRLDTYSLKTGMKPGQKKTYPGRIRGWPNRCDYWYADEAALAIVRAMPPGENDVSRAIKAIDGG